MKTKPARPPAPAPAPDVKAAPPTVVGRLAELSRVTNVASFVLAGVELTLTGGVPDGAEDGAEPAPADLDALLGQVERRAGEVRAAADRVAALLGAFAGGRPN